MGVNHLGPGGMEQQIARLWTAVKAISKATLQNGAIGRAGLRIYNGGWLRIENGGLSVTGSAVVSGTATINGLLTGSGNIDWYGPSIFRGTVNVTGNMATSGTLAVLGATTLTGDVTLQNDLTLGPSGQINAGTVRINRFGSYGGQIVSTGSVLYLGAAASVIVGAEYLSTNKIEGTDAKFFTLDVLGAKSFRMPHPTKPGMWLRHGSTESPVSGIEYWGDEVLGADGKFVVELPAYFEALAKPEGRVPFATGRGFNADWTDIEDGKFTVTGEPGGRFSWQVKAERIGGDFLLEEEIAAPVEEPEEGSAP